VALTATQWLRLSSVAAAALGWTGLAVILLACVRLEPTTPFPGTAALLPVLGMALVLGAGCATPDRGVGRVLSLAPLRAGGRVSYSLYLWHWPVLVLAPVLLAHPLGLAGRMTAVLFSVVLAQITLRLIEDPFRAAEKAATMAGGGQYADVTDLFCAPDRCPPMVGNTLVYFDEEHLTVQYTQTLAPLIGALADRSLVGSIPS
jgi:peptidoglycan/LPS O-acetylase OafA/YrhL